jgi:xanthine dehydrogenase YagS FAD-binding subunit
MESFEWIDAHSVAHAARLLAASDGDGPIVAKAGGIDLIDLMKEGIIRPSRVVNLKSIQGLDRLAFQADGGMRIGPLVTLTQLAEAPEIRSQYPALASAAEHTATPQIRAAATIGGNLLQRPRDWYFRHALFHRHEIDLPAAIANGENQYHAIFDNATTALVHASTPATALIAYGAVVELADAQGRVRLLRLQEFLSPPDATRDRDASLARGEILTAVMLPAVSQHTRAAYRKHTDRDSYDWPICDVAVVLEIEPAGVSTASIVMGWVAPTPRRAVESERLLIGERVTLAVARRAAAAAVTNATPLSKNAYKVPVLEAVVRRTILATTSVRRDV